MDEGGRARSVNALYKPDLEDLKGLLSVPPHHTNRKTKAGLRFLPCLQFFELLY